MQHYRTKERLCHKYQLSFYQPHESTTSLTCSYHKGRLGCCGRGVSCEPHACLLSKYMRSDGHRGHQPEGNWQQSNEK